MNMEREDFARYIRNFDLKSLFIELGWDVPHHPLAPISIKEERFTFEPIAQKSGFLIILVRSDNGSIPYYAVRSRIDNEIRKRSHEHMLIFLDREQTAQVWLYSYQVNGKFRKTEISWNNYQNPERLYQRASGLFFGIDEQDRITIYDVTKRMMSSFATNSEKVTKKFYDGFKKQHTKFMNAMNGIADPTDKEWYASLMLNRLMFCYFMQKRGFLNNDRDYLKHKLDECRDKFGKNKFFSFYRNFLLVLFHKGLAQPQHDPETIDLIGRIPYLNGGLFDVHQLEQTYPEITIDDSAFDSVFALFDAYEWHLDSRECASGNEISPDVLGYIFEKYINDRAQMGAYYTQEDITEYIGRNCIIPFLFNKVKEKYADFFSQERELWTMLKESGDKYIFDAVKKGCEHPLPNYIEIGVDTDKPNLVERRRRWNEPADEAYALPTEIWRETVERRQRYETIRAKIKNGEIHQIQDFITYNLDICAFAQDAIETLDDPAFIRAMYSSISEITILDPTCGSGAFLFAALNLLEPLYDGCLSRMEDFLTNGQTLPQNAKKLFTETVEKKNVHPNKQYFIYKSIILNNLYGVDIMNEAVETAKLRLFLKLVSTAEPNYNAENIGIEPLPDIDFNIKSGNTLVGYGTESEVENALSTTVEGLLLQKDVREKLQNLSQAMRRFKEIQLEQNSDHDAFLQEKQKLLTRQAQVNEILDTTLYHSGNDAQSFEDWMSKAHPFHWIAEFYKIIDKQNGNGGFDVVIGNPPYLEIKQVDYSISSKVYETYDSNAIHSMCIERSLSLLKSNGCISMIVPMSIVSTQRMKSTHNLLSKNNTVYFSNFSWRPGKLFEAVNRALTIFVTFPSKKVIYTTGYTKWNSENRDYLFSNINYIEFDKNILGDTYWIGKFSNQYDQSILKKISNSKNYFLSKIYKYGKPVYYKTTGGLYWKIFTSEPPKFYINGKPGHSSRETHLTVKNQNEVYKSIAIFSSTTYWWWYTITSNLRDLNPSDLNNFILPLNWESSDDLVELGKCYIQDINSKSSMLQRIQKKTGITQVQSFKVQLSKPIIDRIDKSLSKAYGFTEEELDYIINYDIKFRMGIGSDDSEE